MPPPLPQPQKGWVDLNTLKVQHCYTFLRHHVHSDTPLQQHNLATFFPPLLF